MIYENYIALDWAQRNMAVAHMIKNSSEISTIDVVSNIKALKAYIALRQAKPFYLVLI